MYHVITGFYTSELIPYLIKAQMVVNSALCEDYGENAVDRSTLSRWASSFHEGRTGVEGDSKTAVARLRTPLGILP